MKPERDSPLLDARNIYFASSTATANQQSRTSDRGYVPVRRSRAYTPHAHARLRPRCDACTGTQRNVTRTRVRMMKRCTPGQFDLRHFESEPTRSWACVETLGCRTGFAWAAAYYIWPGTRALWWTRQVITRVETTMRGARHSRHSYTRAYVYMRACVHTRVRTSDQRGPFAGFARGGFRLIPRDRLSKRETEMEMNFFKDTRRFSR